MLSSARVLFVSHCAAKPAGAEFVLRDIVKMFPNSATFLFEDGKLRIIFDEQGSKTILAKTSKDMSSVKRDSNLLKTALPLAGSMISIVRQIIEAAKPYDVIYANSQKAFILSAIAAKISRKKLIWHLHDILTPEHFSAPQIKLGVFLANNAASAVIVPSNATGTAVVNAGYKKTPVTVYNGVKQIELSPFSKQELRKQLGLPNGFLYGTFSRLSSWKGQHIAIEALGHIARVNNSDIHCIIVGDAQFGEDEYGKGLRVLAEKLGIVDRVHFLGHRTDVPLLMQAVDCYVHPSVAPEPFSLAILEAASMGLPMIASDTGGIPEVIINDQYGLLCQPGNARAFANAIIRIYESKHYAEFMGRQVQKLVNTTFTIEAMQNKVVRYCR